MPLYPLGDVSTGSRPPTSGSWARGLNIYGDRSAACPPARLALPPSTLNPAPWRWPAVWHRGGIPASRAGAGPAEVGVHNQRQVTAAAAESTAVPAHGRHSIAASEAAPQPRGDSFTDSTTPCQRRRHRYRPGDDDLHSLHPRESNVACQAAVWGWPVL